MSAINNKIKNFSACFLFFCMSCFAFSCNNKIYPTTQYQPASLKSDTLIVEKESIHLGKSPSGFTVSDTCNTAPDFYLNKTSLNNESKALVYTTNHETNFAHTDTAANSSKVRKEKELPTTRNVNEAFVMSIVSFLFLPIGLTILLSTTALIKSLNYKKINNANPNLNLNKRRINTTILLSILGLVLFIIGTILLIIYLMTFSLFSGFVLIGA